MVTTSIRIDEPGVRDWPTLRDLVVRASVTHQCREIAAAVSEAPAVVMAWRQRMADLCGRDRLALFARDHEGRAYALVAAYVDDVSLAQRRITVDWGLDY